MPLVELAECNQLFSDIGNKSRTVNTPEGAVERFWHSARSDPDFKTIRGRHFNEEVMLADVAGREVVNQACTGGFTEQHLYENCKLKGRYSVPEEVGIAFTYAALLAF